MMKLKLIVEEEVRGAALGLLDDLLNELKRQQKITRIERGLKEGKLRNVLRTFKPETAKAYVEFLKGGANYEYLKQKACEIVIDAAYEYLHMWYMHKIQFIPMEMKLVFLVMPPQITCPDMYSDYIDPEDYINLTFFNIFTDKVHKRNLIGKFVGRSLFAYYDLYAKSADEIAQRFAKRLTPELRAVFFNIYNRYRREKGNEYRAVRLARRDTVRIAIANMWLVWAWFAERQGVAKPHRYPVYTIGCAMLDGHRIINPIECIPPEERHQVDKEFESLTGYKLSQITWTEALEQYAKTIGFKTLTDYLQILQQKCTEMRQRTKT